MSSGNQSLNDRKRMFSDLRNKTMEKKSANFDLNKLKSTF